MNNLLVVSTLFLLFPIIIFYKKNNKNIYEIILAALLCINIILSSLFWIEPIKNSEIHNYNKIFAKILAIVFTIYILFIKNIKNLYKLIFLIILLFSLLSFFYSNKCSSETWCSNNHILCHFIFHIFISIGCLFAFIK